MFKEMLSTDVVSMKSEYDVVVIGSGYGGSIAASRMARAGKSVCLLEKGKEIRPGDYPSTEKEAMKEMFVNADRLKLGHENNLYQFDVGHDITVFHGCGLGGTSLINANVSLPPEKRVFDDPHWPAELRNNLEQLWEGMDLAKKVLQPSAYP